ncbi:MAG: hypothetical protein JWQ00_2930 [Noviherbaspirillum sp.]|nr:hypothetical protein [Noviherbaspirillum sp.]
MTAGPVPFTTDARLDRFDFSFGTSVHRWNSWPGRGDAHWPRTTRSDTEHDLTIIDRKRLRDPISGIRN